MSLGVSAGGLLLLGITVAFAGGVSMAVAASGYGLVYLGLGAAGPSENDLLHRRVARSGRATALSVQSLALQLTGAVTGVVAGALSPGPVPWLVGATVLLGGALLWTHRSDPKPQTVAAMPQSHDVPSPSTVSPR
ncbi:hypothetical protein ABT009_15715 [Streptomyces sp. NPDC002896]|uniref:hypothetical protein n=1 Tax=Streptomyces sp. NPDC002896 TaxID=3154438 RepID=UPI003319540C